MTLDELIQRAARELVEDGVIHVDTFVDLSNRGIDPTTIEEIIHE